MAQKDYQEWLIDGQIRAHICQEKGRGAFYPQAVLVACDHLNGHEGDILLESVHLFLKVELVGCYYNLGPSQRSIRIPVWIPERWEEGFLGLELVLEAGDMLSPRHSLLKILII